MSKVALGALLSVPPVKRDSTPPVHVLGAWHTTVRVLSCLFALPVMVTGPASVRRLLPEMLPPDQANGALRVRAPMPPSVPPLRFSSAGLMVASALKLAVPPAMIQVPPAKLNPPLKLIYTEAKPLTVLVPEVLTAPFMRTGLRQG